MKYRSTQPACPRCGTSIDPALIEIAKDSIVSSFCLPCKKPVLISKDAGFLVIRSDYALSRYDLSLLSTDDRSRDTGPFDQTAAAAMTGTQIKNLHRTLGRATLTGLGNPRKWETLTTEDLADSPITATKSAAGFRDRGAAHIAGLAPNPAMSGQKWWHKLEPQRLEQIQRGLGVEPGGILGPRTEASLRAAVLSVCQACNGYGFLHSPMGEMVCPSCHGQRRIDTRPRSSDPDACQTCGGHGTVLAAGNEGDCPTCGGRGTKPKPCANCEGSGILAEDNWNACPACHGQGVMS